MRGRLTRTLAPKTLQASGRIIDRQYEQEPRMKSSRQLVCLTFAGLLTAVGIARAENWPQWRGPRNDGISSEKNVPLEWSRSENVAWRLKLPNRAGATPVVWGDRIFLTSPAEDDKRLLLICVGTDG